MVQSAMEPSVPLMAQLLRAASSKQPLDCFFNGFSLGLFLPASVLCCSLTHAFAGLRVV